MFSLHGALTRYVNGFTPLLSHSPALSTTGIKIGRQFVCIPYLRNTPTSGFVEIRATEKIEEETITCHNLTDYYPVTLGEVFRSRYQVVSKQGYGVGSTVWLCRDLIENRHLTLKVCVRRAKQQSHELEISDHLSKCDAAHKTGHPGKRLVQTVFDSFEIDGPYGSHVCLLYQPLGMKLSEVIARMPNGLIPADILQRTTQLLFVALDYIHRRGIVHTGKCGKSRKGKTATRHCVTNSAGLIFA
jgi:serine/threonine-protein kinase SRPK3